MKLFDIIRHGETEYNRQRKVQGSGIDSELNDKGKAQAEAFFQTYKEEPYEIVITSGLQRTHQTVAPFLERGLPWEQWPELNEMGWGIHEGKRSNVHMKMEYERMMSAWSQGDFSARLEGGESLEDLLKRIHIAVDRFRALEYKRVLVCSHGRAMKCLMSVLDGAPPQEMDTYSHSNTGLYRVRYQPPTFEIQLRNSMTHYSDNG